MLIASPVKVMTHFSDRSVDAFLRGGTISPFFFFFHSAPDHGGPWIPAHFQVVHNLKLARMKGSDAVDMCLM